MTVNRIAILLKSKTLWGSIFAAGAWLIAQPTVGLVQVAQALGTVISAAGVRDAITQHGISPDAQ